MNRLMILIIILSSKILIHFLTASSEILEIQDVQKIMPAIKVVHIEDQTETPFLNPEDLINPVSQMLHQSGYHHDATKICIKKAQKNQIAIIETNQGIKFVKIKKRGGGINEYLGTFLFKDLARIIPVEKLIISRNMELLVQPFIPSALQEAGLLFHAISQLEFKDEPETWELIRSIFSDSLKLSTSTMHYSVRNARNDEFFFDRLKTQAQEGISGRIELIYKGKNFKLMNLELPWEELKALNWVIDGVAYQETLDELLAKARYQLDPGKQRLMGSSHGNWHENNVMINGIDHDAIPYKYAYIALEFAGENDLVTDAAMFLVHTTVYADYLNPVYYPNVYGNNQIVEQVSGKTALMKERSIAISRDGNKINISGIDSFGTLGSRKQVAHLFDEQYFKPMIRQAVELFREKLSGSIDNHFRAALLLRLLGGQDLLKLMPRDQVMMIGLIYRSLGTPIEGTLNQSAITRFIDAL